MSVIRRSELDFADLPGRQSADGLVGAAAASSVRVVRMAYTEGRTAHRHPHSEEIVVVAQGTGTVWVDGERTAVGPGDVVHIGAGAAHATIPDPDVEMELICFFPHPALDENIEHTDIDVTKEER